MVVLPRSRKRKPSPLRLMCYFLILIVVLLQLLSLFAFPGAAENEAPSNRYVTARRNMERRRKENREWMQWRLKQTVQSRRRRSEEHLMKLTKEESLRKIRIHFEEFYAVPELTSKELLALQPIDVVYTWVDGSDPVWLKEHMEWRERLQVDAAERVEQEKRDRTMVASASGWWGMPPSQGSGSGSQQHRRVNSTSAAVPSHDNLSDDADTDGHDGERAVNETHGVPETPSNTSLPSPTPTAPPPQYHHLDNPLTRFRESGTLKFSLRSLVQYGLLPSIRKIFIVTDGQVPKWLDVHHPQVEIVYHRDIFPFPATQLPTYNSFAIESCLHRIPGLAEHFIYFNDDMLLGHDVTVGEWYYSCPTMQQKWGPGSTQLNETYIHAQAPEWKWDGRDIIPPPRAIRRKKKANVPVPPIREEEDGVHLPDGVVLDLPDDGDGDESTESREGVREGDENMDGAELVDRLADSVTRIDDDGDSARTLRDTEADIGFGEHASKPPREEGGDEGSNTTLPPSGTTLKDRQLLEKKPPSSRGKVSSWLTGWNWSGIWSGKRAYRRAYIRPTGKGPGFTFGVAPYNQTCGYILNFDRVAVDTSGQNSHNTAMTHTSKVLVKRFGQQHPVLNETIFFPLAHEPVIVNKSLMAELESLLPQEFDGVRRVRFREGNMWYAIFGYAYYALHVKAMAAEPLGKYHTWAPLQRAFNDQRSSPISQTDSLAPKDMRAMLHMATIRESKFINIQDDHGKSRDLLKMVDVWLKQSYPSPSSFEMGKGSAKNSTIVTA